MSLVDNTNVRRKQKLKIYSIGVCSRLAWLLMIATLPITWVERNLNPIASSFLKKWTDLATCTTPDILFLKKEHGGLNLPSVSTSYEKLQVSRFSQLLLSQYNLVRFLADRGLRDDLELSGVAFQPNIVVCDSLASDPGMSKASLKCCAQKAITSVDDETRLQHLMSLQVQGECFRFGDQPTGGIWTLAVQTLPDIIFKFALNATLGTLPHQKNLHKWKKSESEKCLLCGATQSLLHALLHLIYDVMISATTPS